MITDDTRLRLFSDRRYLPEGSRHVPMLIPFWGTYQDDGDPSATLRYDRYAAEGQRHLQMVPLVDADAAVLPVDWGKAQGGVLVGELRAAAAAQGKPTVIFFEGDSTAPIRVDNSMVFRASLDRAERLPSEHAMPGFCQDLAQVYCGGDVRVRPYRSRPTVGFCGHASAPKEEVRYALLQHSPRWLLKLLLRLGMSSEIAIGRALRRRAMRRLAAVKGVECNFVVRQRFWNGVYGSDGQMNLQLAQESRLAFVQNLLDSDYALCVRGFGNYSFRLYEALSLGRIPVFINTDCVLPYDRWIDWKRYVVWVEQSEVDRIAETVQEFHASLTPAGFADLQRSCRQLWDEWLSPHGFFAQFHRHFEG